MRVRRAQIAMIRVDVSIFGACDLDEDDVNGMMSYRDSLPPFSGVHI